MNTEDAHKELTVAVAGNPNCGKTSIFNHLTGTLQTVGNYPGVTVEKKEGKRSFGSRKFCFVDLPGTYSLTAYSIEEIIARNYLIEEKPDVVLDILDASNLERNLYLTVQLMELDEPLVIALNMVDICVRKGFTLDSGKMSKLLGVPVVQTVGNRGEGVTELLATLSEDKGCDPAKLSNLISYGHEVEREIRDLTEICAGAAELTERSSARWTAIKLLEKDDAVSKMVRETAHDAGKIMQAANSAIRRIEEHFGDTSETIIAERRYGFAAGVVRECVSLTGAHRRDITDKIDSVVCNKFMGPVVLGGVVYALFLSTFKLADEWKWMFGRSLTGWVELFFEKLSAATTGLEDAAPALYSLLNDGVISGVGGVLSFVPLIFCMFLFVAALEDTGYIARIAFILDKALKTFGLQGKSILAMIVSGGLGGGGCAVPGVMATRTLKEEKDRLVTILVAPIMNCGAKMPVYMMLIAAFFAARKAEMLFSLWLLSWVFALSAAFLLRKFVVKGDQDPFVMELPAYHIPTIKGVLLHTSERTWMYVKKAGTIILAINIIIWAAMYFPRLSESERNDIRKEVSRGMDVNVSAGEAAIKNEIASIQLSRSVAGRLGRGLEPVSRIAGFDWRTNIALIGGFAAKEVIVGVLGTAYAMGETDAEDSGSVSSKLAANPDWNPVKAFALMLFVMIYAPCFVTVTVIRRETGSWKWALFSVLYTTVTGFIVAVIVYQLGMLFTAG